MSNITKKQLWAAFLTVAAVLAMPGCSALTGDTDTTKYSEATIGIVDTTEEFESQTDYSYIKNDDGTIAVSGYKGNETVATVPETIDGMNVTAIADHAFEANWNLEEVILPEGITYIGESAFMDCGNLKKVNIPESTETLRRAAFAGCSVLDNIVVPAKTSVIMEETFSGCASLKSLTIVNDAVTYANWGLDKEVMPELTITCPDGSTTMDWARNNGFDTVVL